MNDRQLPKVAVLLAAYNGEKYIKEQIKSIANQVNVDIFTYISIDISNDRTLEICKELKDTYKNIFIINEGKERFGSAGKNFYYLIKNVDFKEFDYIAFSDQDDIWKPSKIIRGIQILEKENASGYSSDVECFWDDFSRKNKIVKKSYPQRKYDFYFEPAGPGCTYILDHALADAIKKNILQSPKLPFHHDWFIYAFARSNSYKWHIDNAPLILYRQHSKNQVGANIGLVQKIKRIKILKDKKFKKYHLEIKNYFSPNYKNIKKDILSNPFNFRRKKIEALGILIFAILGWI